MLADQPCKKDISDSVSKKLTNEIKDATIVVFYSSNITLKKHLCLQILMTLN